MFSTAHDLYLFGQPLRSNKLLDKSTPKEVFSENKSVGPGYYGLGWYVALNAKEHFQIFTVSLEQAGGNSTLGKLLSV